MNKFASLIIFKQIFYAIVLVVMSGCTGGATSEVTKGIASPTPLPLPTMTPSPTPIPCSLQVGEFLQRVSEVLTQFDDANQLASNTARIALSQPVARLQDIRQQLDKMPAPDCYKLVKQPFLWYMNDIIDGYLAFMGQADSVGVMSQFAKAEDTLGELMVVLEMVHTGDLAPLSIVEYKAGSLGKISVGYSTIRGAQREDVNKSWTDKRIFFGGHEPQLTVEDKSGYLGAYCELWINGKLIDRRTITQLHETIVCKSR